MINNYIDSILNEKNLKLQYTMVIDYIRNYIDKSFNMSDKCDFINGKCIGNRLCKSVHSKDGCCYTHGKVCKFLKDNKCSIESISCKLFMCDYLERKYGKIQLSKIFPVKKVFNKRQIAILKYSFFIDKTDLVDILLKHI